MLPNFLIIGAARAGTTWMAWNLGQHPDVYVPRVKELHFFDKHYDNGIAYYEQFFEGTGQESAVGEATPAYLHGLRSEFDIPVLIKKHIPNAKLIVSLRDPVDRLYSRYWNAKAKYPGVAQLSFEEQIESAPDLVEEGFYYDQLVRYFDVFPREQALVLLYDDLKLTPAEFLRSMFLFLEVDPGFVSGMEGIRRGAAASKGSLGKSKVLWNLLRGLRRIGAHEAASYVEKFNRVELPPMRDDTKARLAEIYREQNLRLQDLIGRDLSAWCGVTASVGDRS